MLSRAPGRWTAARTWLMEFHRSQNCCIPFESTPAGSIAKWANHKRRSIFRVAFLLRHHSEQILSFEENNDCNNSPPNLRGQTRRFILEAIRNARRTASLPLMHVCMHARMHAPAKPTMHPCMNPPRANASNQSLAGRRQHFSAARERCDLWIFPAVNSGAEMRTLESRMGSVLFVGFPRRDIILMMRAVSA